MDATVDKRLADLYPEHLAAVRSRFDEALEASEYDAIVVGAGVEIFWFLDDQTYPFNTNPHLVQWLPLTAHPESCLIYKPGERPRLVIYQPDDFWHKPPEPPGAPWAEHFDIETAPTPEAVRATWAELPERTSFLGDTRQWRSDHDEASCNPSALLNHLHYYRPFKTPYEIECIRAATRLAVPAHRAAEAAFRTGAAEYDILLEFLAACRQTPVELPYQAIIAQNRNAAVLHYQHYERSSASSDSLLIDAACSAYGYASDITRTYAFANAEFGALIDAVDDAQRTMVAEVRPGKPFAELHDFAHRAIARLLSEQGLVDGDPENFIERGITAAFFPHGLGHFLGIQVHEVGGSFADVAGNELERPVEYPNLRLVRTLEPGQVLTIEPGIYFIDTLLAGLKDGPHGADVNWERVERLHKFGGIRIEDNIAVTDSGGENLTRDAFERVPATG